MMKPDAASAAVQARNNVNELDNLDAALARARSRDESDKINDEIAVVVSKLLELDAQARNSQALDTAGAVYQLQAVGSVLGILHGGDYRDPALRTRVLLEASRAIKSLLTFLDPSGLHRFGDEFYLIPEPKSAGPVLNGEVCHVATA